MRRSWKNYVKNKTMSADADFECMTDIFLLFLKDHAFPFRALQISWVMVPIGQYTHQLRGLNSTMVISPRTVEVSITL